MGSPIRHQFIHVPPHQRRYVFNFLLITFSTRDLQEPRGLFFCRRLHALSGLDEEAELLVCHRYDFCD